ncbi:type II secretion system F family protein [Petroclostridium sp. X23]|uniref:type II secretion system F family protein n=1 Tax=Petroclostridium sp. X23 TaxID=3045146 RepID=UPI0024AD8327|nr:type II secretion system F family protein [Petroclostridium sp. X23]WHH60535.1 type II secretion system F family protein [Petroclostridium sp. X23]
MLYLIISLSFVTAIILVYGTIRLFFIKSKLVDRVEKYVNIQQISDDNDEDKFLKRIMKGILLSGRGMGNLGIFNGYKKYVQSQLIKAHIPLKGEEFITICIMSTAACAVAFMLIAQSIITGLLFGVIGWFIPMLFVQSKKKKRIKQLNDQLGDAITLVSNSLKAGYSFFQAVDTASGEMSGSIAEEFMQLKKEVNLGLSTEQALENLVKRVESDDLELVVTAIMIQRQVGGNLAEILDNISETIQERVRIKGEVRTLTAQGRMSGIIIGIIPPAMGAVLAVINPEHIGVLFTRKLGLLMIVCSVIMELMGIYFINKIVKIEV